MRKLYVLSTLVLTIFYGSKAYTQDFSNKGKEFYLCFPNHVPNGNNLANLATLSIFITSDKASSGTITMANGAFSSTFNIVAYGIQEISIPWNANIHISNGESNTIIQKSIKVKTDPGKPAVVAYAQQYAGQRSTATLLLPTNVLGKKYRSISFTQNGSNNNTYIARSQFQIIAVKPNTVIKITPFKNGIMGATINVTFPNAGDMYQYQSTDAAAASQDLSGTFIESIASGNSGCNPIAVFSGTSNTTFGTQTCNGGSSDPLWQQLYPISTWGKNFGLVPFADYPNGVPYRVLASEDNTNVYFNGGLVATLNAGQIYPTVFTSNPTVLTTPTSITADKPVCVTEYAQAQNCSGNGINVGDPDMVILNPIEQNIKDITVFSSTKQNITRQYVNVLLQTNAVPSFKISKNGGPLLPPVAFWQVFTNLPGYSYLKESLTGVSSARLVADSGFNAIAYGFGSVESYAYSAGTNVKDLYQQIGVSTQFGIEPTPSVCKGSPFKFKVSLPYCADSILWDLSFLPGPPTPPATIIYTTCTPGSGGPDSTTIVNGKTLYWYSLPSTYIFNTAGSFPVTITTYTPNTDGCGSEQDIDFELNVFDPPIADFTFINGGCMMEQVQFTDNTTTPRPSYIWNWNFDDPGSGPSNISGLRNPTHTFSGPGTYNVTFNTITTPGCISATITKQVIVRPIPSATITGDVTVCVSDPAPLVTFTITGGTAPYTISYHVNTGPAVHINSPTNTVPLNFPTNFAGTFRIYLDSVKNTGSTLCATTYSNTYVDVVVNANTGLALDPGSNNNQTVCQNAGISNILYTVSGGGNNATITWSPSAPAGINSVYNNITKKFTISGTPTGISGTYTYTVEATGLCLPSQLTGMVTVNQLPTASIIGSAAEVCKDAPSPTVTLIGSGGTAPYQFNYKLNGVAQTPVTSTGNIYTITVPTTVPDTFMYELTDITDASSTLCSQTQTGSASVIVHPLPVPDFSLSTPTCETKVLSFTDLSTPNVGSLTTWAWNFGDGVGTSSSPSPTYTYAAAGNYPVTLSVTNSKGCVSNPVLVRSVTVNPQPVTGFILPEVCLSDTYAQFTDTTRITSGSIVTWLWNFGDPGSGVLNTSPWQHPQHSYSAVGNYFVTLTTTSNSGCITTLTQSFTVNGDIPVSNFNALNPAIMCANDSIAIQDNSTVNFGSVTKVEIYWDNVNFPGVFQTDDFPTSGKIYRHLYPNFQTPVTRSFDIRYRAYSGATCINDRIKTIVVNAAPKVQFLDMPDVCLDAIPFQITQATEIGGVAGPPGVFTGPGVSATGIFNPASVGPGTYWIKYTFTSTAGGCVDTLSKPITVIDSASARFTYSTLNCEGSPVSFNSTTSTIPAASGTITGWSWDFGDPASGAANTATTQNPTHVFSGWGTYNVRLFVTTSNGCRSTIRTIPVFVNPVPRTNFSFPASSCLPSATVAFNSSSSTIPDGTQSSFTYLWDFGDPASGALNTSTGSNPSHIYNSVGPFNVTLQITSGAGCVNSRTISVNTIHPEPRGAFTSNKDDLCVGDAFIFTDNSDPADGTTQLYSWNLGDGNIRTSAVVNHTYASAGTYTVTLFTTNSHGCRSSMATKIVSVNPYPIVNAGPDVFILEGGSDTLKPIVTAINPTFLWTPNFYFLSSNTIMNPIVKGVEDFTYTLIVTGRGGCSREDQVFIKVLKGPEIPNIFSPNGDGVHDKWEIKYLDTYPGGTVEIFNRYGQLIWRSVGYGTPWDGTINGNPVPMGTYYYIVNPKNGRKTMSGYVDVIR